ncbi:hypothetical protein T12_12967, partial [Trichinella patagoniensis]
MNEKVKRKILKRIRRSQRSEQNQRRAINLSKIRLLN